MTDATIRPDDIRWRVSNTWGPDDKKMGMLVGYIDARTAMEALDALDENWSAVHGTPIVVGSELIGVPLALTVNGVTRSDVGMPSSQEPIKGAYSGALKRAAVHFGIGRELYELPKIAVECEVKNGKVKGPKALPAFRNGRWEIDRKLGWVRYDREPDDQPERSGSGAVGPRSGAPTSAPAPRTPEEQALADQIADVPGMTHARMSLLADAVGVVRGERATADQLRHMIALIESPSDGVGTPSTAEGASETARASGAPPTPSSEAATAQAGDIAPPDTQPVPDSTGLLDAVLEATGGELVPPKPGTDEYRALPTAQEKAQARAYWQRNEVPA